MNKLLKEKIKTIPHSPGCYRYFDKKGRLIYIGKAKDLKKRVSSYFVGKFSQTSDVWEVDPKTRVLVENIANVSWEVTDSEVEALVLESLLIKRYKPKFNIKVKDDKDFLWVKIDMGAEFPQPELVRRPNVGDTARGLPKKGGHIGPPPRKIKIFGPFTDSKLLKEGLAVLRKAFLWRDCSDSKLGFYHKKGKPCLEYYIKNCSAPCLISSKHVSSKLVSNRNGSQLEYTNANDYQLGIRQLITFLGGGKKKLIGDIEREMKKLSKKKEFEKAALYRDRLRSLQHIDAGWKMKRVDQDEKTKDLEKFIDRINLDLGYNLTQKKDFRIEFYDISNTAGSESVGSMVVWQGNRFNKSEYRKFKIRTVFGINDYKMMEEVLARRIKRADWKLPDLFVMDGGKGQLGTIYRLFLAKGIEVPIVSLAKREEEVFGVKDGRFRKTNIIKNSPEGFFVQRIRDEAHRFAIGYHKNLRAKGLIRSRLDDIEGIGPATKKKLLLKFGSVDGIMGAGLADVSEVVGNKVAGRIKEVL